MISGFFPVDRQPHPYVQVAVRLPAVSADWTLIDFLIDTGASRTSIHPLDAIRRIGLSPAALSDRSLWSTTVPSGGVGGSATYFDLQAEYGFQDRDGSWAVVQGSVMLAELTASNQRIPSLLGWDLLQFFELKTHGLAQTVSLDWLTAPAALPPPPA